MHFTVTNKEPVRLLLNATKAPDFGIYQFTLDGVKLGGPVDFYDPKIVNEECQLLDFWPEPGQYTLRMECTGKNIASSGYSCGVESLRLRGRRPRVTAMGHDKDKDWRKDPETLQRLKSSPFMRHRPLPTAAATPPALANAIIRCCWRASF